MSRGEVREAVSGCLVAILGAGCEEERRAAEQEIKVLEVTGGEWKRPANAQWQWRSCSLNSCNKLLKCTHANGALAPCGLCHYFQRCFCYNYVEYGVVLAELVASRDVGVAYRQLASVLLKQYVETHWSNLSDKFTEPVPDEQVGTSN